MSILRGIHAAPPAPDAERIAALPGRLAALRGDAPLPDGSIVVPVNAQGDLDHVLALLTDVARYRGERSFEVILVVNNYDEGAEPPRLARLEGLGACVLAIPNVRCRARQGEAVPLVARILGTRAASSDVTIQFDADVRLPAPTALLDWYAATLRGGAGAGYGHVGFHSVPPGRPGEVSILLHHLGRWGKRAMLRIPTIRGSAFAARRSLLLDLYDRGVLADDMNIGPAIRACGWPVVYDGRAGLTALTSGRMYRVGWRDLVPYYRYRLRYNVRVLPVRSDVARRTGRERDPVRRYVDDRPVR